MNLLNYDTWKIPLTIAINYISLKDAEDKCVMESRSKNKKDSILC